MQRVEKMILVLLWVTDTIITTPAGERALASEQAQRRNPK